MNNFSLKRIILLTDWRKNMVYGVVVVHDTNDYSKMTMRLWRNGNASLLMNKGCEAVFITEHSAFAYAYDEAEKRNIEFDPKVCDVE